MEDARCPDCGHKLSLHTDKGCTDECACPLWWAEGLILERFKATSSIFASKQDSTIAKPLLISFFGPSTAGKSTCYTFAKERLEQLNYFPVRLDVALPLRQIQKEAYEVFQIEDPGKPDLPENFRQDGKLLEFLAEHFQNFLGSAFTYKFSRIVDSTKAYISLQKTPLAVINTDCRNNCYDTLKGLGFTFIRVQTSEAVMQQRKSLRGDATPYSDSSAVEAFDRIQAKYQINNDKGLASLATNVFSVIDALVAGNKSIVSG